MKKLLVLLAASAAWVAPAIHAVEFSGNVTLTSDYSFRGETQTGRDPAIQGGFDLSFDSGFSIGTWASNVNFGPYRGESEGGPSDPTYASMELDLYVGYGAEIGDNSSWNVSLIRFEYPNEGAADYTELAFAVAIGDLTVGANYSPEYLGESGDAFFYPYVGYSVALGEIASLDAQVGHGIGDAGEHLDYSFTLGASVAGLDLAVGLVGTDIDDGRPGNELRPVVSLSKSL